MVRFALAAWVLLSVPICIAIGHLYQGSRKSSDDAGWDPHEVAVMLKRNGFHHPH